MRVKSEELSAIGVTLMDKEYQSALLKALPDEVSKYASSLLDAGRLWSPSTTIDTQNFIGFVAAEADCLSSKRKRDNASKGKGKNTGAQDEALAATASQ